MNTPTQAPHSPGDLGAVLRDYPAKATRFIWPGLIGAIAVFGIVSTLSERTQGALLFWLPVAAACAGYSYFFQRNLHVQLHAQGFIWTRGNTTRIVRWEEIKKVERWARTTSTLGITTSSTPIYFLVTLTNGKTIKIGRSLQDWAKLGAILQRMAAR